MRKGTLSLADPDFLAVRRRPARWAGAGESRRSPLKPFVPGHQRRLESLEARDRELHDVEGGSLTPVPMPENKAPALAFLCAPPQPSRHSACPASGGAHPFPTVAPRLLKVHAQRQRFSNQIIGDPVHRIGRLLLSYARLRFADGLRRRDSVGFHGVARGSRLFPETPAAAGQVSLDRNAPRRLWRRGPKTFLPAQIRLSAIRGREFNVGGGPSHTTSLFELMILNGGLRGRAPEVRFDAGRPADQPPSTRAI
jgi:hypothetical protein